MNLRSRKVAVILSAAACAAIITCIVIFNGTAKTTTENSRSIAKETEETTESKNILADIEANRPILVGTKEDEIIEKQSEENEEAKQAEQSTETQTAETQPETEAPSPYENKFIVNVNEYLNIRSAADENSEVVGKLYEGAGGDILEKGEQWTHISSGSVEGYVSNDYILTGKDAESKISEVGTPTATVTADNIRVRETPDANGKIYGLADINEEFVCSNILDGWIEIQYDGGAAYISSEFTSVEMKIKQAVSIEEENARLLAEAKEQEKTVQEERFEETVQTDAYNVSYDDAYLLACLVYAEAGSEPYEGKLATANIVLNRLNSGKYGNTISDVINAPGQFSVVRLGTFAAALSSGPNSQSIQAANEALSGVNNVPSYRSFCSLSHANYGAYNSYTVIGNQVYYN